MGGAYRYLIGFLCAAALLAILAIGFGSDLDETGAKAIGSALAFAFCCLTGGAGASLARRRPALALFGYLTGAASLLAFLAVMSALWIHGFGGGSDDWRIAGIGLVLALAGGHISLLLSNAQPEDAEEVRLVRGATIVVLAMLAVVAVAELASRGQQVGPKPIAILIVLYLLGALLVPVLRRAGPRGGAA